MYSDTAISDDISGIKKKQFKFEEVVNVILKEKIVNLVK